ncbi:MAG: alpha/beta hydrolase [Caldilineaceae bacterium]|nr:alpha/beta hydrolase [Caldilineaceae bacterium]
MSSWTSNTVDANGITLHYWRTGGDKPPLVLCHGITDNGLCWTRAARVLEAHFDVIMLDARGHGESSKPASGYTSDVHAADLAAFIEALDLDKPALMGHSMGAATVSTMAYQRPDLTRRIVLEDPPWRIQTPEEVAAGAAGLAAWRDNLAADQKLTRAEIIANGKRARPTWADEEFEAWAQAKQQVSLNVFGYRTAPTAGWQTIAAGLHVPTLLVTADPELDAIVNAEAAALAAQNPNITVVHIPGAGHNIRREQFAAFMDAVSAFLAA